MPMKNPPHPGEVIRAEVLQRLGLSLAKAAEVLGVRRATLSDLTNGKSALTAEMALRLEKAFGVSMDLLLRMQAGYDAAEIRRCAAEIEVRRYWPEIAPATD
jgi:antitoxin HigA-1